MRPKLNVFVRYSIGMFGVGIKMHTRRNHLIPTIKYGGGSDPHRNVSVTTKSTFCNGHLSHQTSIQSKTCGL